MIITVFSFSPGFIGLKEVQAIPNLDGRILLQVEDKGQAWYVNPADSQRYYLGRPDDAFNLMRQFGLGASNKDIDYFLNYKAPSRLAGRIILRVESEGQAYYINPVDLKLHYLGRPADAFEVMRTLGLGITNTNLNQIAVSNNSNETKRFDFKYQNDNYYLIKDLSVARYEEYSNSPKVYTYKVGQKPDNLRDAFYGMLLNTKNDDNSISEIISRFREIVGNKGWTEDQFTEFILAFVQHISYDQAKLAAGNTNPYYPYETLYLQKGVCSDKTFLAVQFLRELGYGAAILDFPDINHTAAGIACPIEHSINNSGYCYVETTNYFPLGIIPQNINGQAEANTDDFDNLFNTNALGNIEILQTTSGKTYQGIAQTKTTIQELKTAQIDYINRLAEINSLETDLETQEANLNTIKAQLDTYLANGQTSEYNALVITYNEGANQYNTDLAVYSTKIEEYNQLITEFNQDIDVFYQR